MELIFKNCIEYKNGSFCDMHDMATSLVSDIETVVNFSDCIILPAFCDVHVHLREPGFFYKETIASGTCAAAHGGYTDVFSMPNLSPVPDCRTSIKEQIDIINRDAIIRVHPYASITIGQRGEHLSDFEELAPYAVAFSDDGKGVQDEGMMREAMERAKALGKFIVAHCEVNSLLNGGYIHDGIYAKKHGHRGICSESEWAHIERDIKLAKETGCKYHVCHISTKESVALIREAKKDGVNISCETAPHYLVLDENDLQEDGRFKMNPPLRSKEDRQALIEGICDGTVDMIATDHAPHSAEEKSRGLEKSAFGIVGLETAFQVLYTDLVKNNIISLTKLTELMSTEPRKRFGLPETKDFCVWDLNCKENISPENFLSKGKATPFAGKEVFGKCLLTVCDGKAVWLNK